MFKVWGNIIYAMDHILHGLSDGMKGGDIRYIVTNRDYGSEFVEMLMDSSLVHLMLFMNHDSLPLGLAHDSCAMYCQLGFCRFGSMHRYGHGGDLQLVRYARIKSISMHIVWFMVGKDGILLNPIWLLLTGAEKNGGQRGYDSVGSKLCIHGHGKPANSILCLSPFNPVVELHFDWLFGWGLDAVAKSISPSGL